MILAARLSWVSSLIPIRYRLLIFFTLIAVFLFFTGGPTVVITHASLSKLGVSSLALAVAYMALFTGLEIIGPVKTSMLLNVEPILTITLAAIMLGERLGSIQFVGAAFVILGIILITGSSKKEDQTKARKMLRKGIV